MDRLFDPESVAVIGASSDPDRISGRPIKFLQQHGYGGDIYPVNPNHEEIAGLRCYPAIEDVPGVPDVAMIAVPARLVPELTEDALRAGVPSVVIISSGFSETGEAENEAAERRLAALADEYDARVIGPNSQGVINFAADATVSFTPALHRTDPPTGAVSFVSQSGAFGGALTTMLQERGIGLYKWVATGNEADLESLDFVAHMAEDDGTDVVAGYLEGFDDGRKLIELKRTRSGIDLPIVAFKVGESERGRSAAASHTGKIASGQRVYEAVFRETGVIGVDDIDLFLSVIRAATTSERLPGSSLGVVTTSGGAGVHIADTAADVGVTLPTLGEDTLSALDAHIPAFGSALNPVDLTAQVVNDSAVFSECLRAVLADASVETLLLQITNASADRAVEYAEIVTEVAAGAETPVFVSWTGGTGKERALERYRAAGIPVFENPARCVRTIAALAGFAASKPRLEAARSLPARPPAPADADPPGVLTEPAAKALLSEYGIDVPAERLLTDPTDAEAAARELGPPVVAKLVSPDIQHRNRVDGVRMDVDAAGAEAVAADLFAIAEREGATAEGVLVQATVPGRLEVGVGVSIDPDFGAVLMLGQGGVDIEAAGDVTFRTIPVAREQAEAMLGEVDAIASADLSRAQRAAIVDAAVAVSACYMDNPWIREADVNPLIVTADGAVAVDALVHGPDGDDA